MIFQPTYFSPIYQFQKLVNADEVFFEVQDNYQKQSYRTRLKIYTPNGLQSLVIPIKHQKGVRLLTKDVEIEYAFDWQKKHLKSLQNSYRSSPYFEYYEDDIMPIYKKKEKYLIDFLFKTQELSFEMLQIDVNYQKTKEYIPKYPKDQDFRFLNDPKLKEVFPIKKYTQVFEGKHGFIPNLSILDLLFNEGPNAISLLDVD
jgi:hypothetical protein